MFMGAQSKTNTAGKLLELVWSIGYTLSPFLGINGTISTSGCSNLAVWVSGLFDISVATAIFLLQEYDIIESVKRPTERRSYCWRCCESKTIFPRPLPSSFFSSLHTTFGTYFITTAITLLQSWLPLLLLLMLLLSDLESIGQAAEFSHPPLPCCVHVMHQQFPLPLLSVKTAT
jgi:hypothetical protein